MERGAEQNGEPGRQAGRDGRSDELMKTARKKNQLPPPRYLFLSDGIEPVSFLVSSVRLVFRLVIACRLLACLLAVPGLSRRLIRFPVIVSFLVSCSLVSSRFSSSLLFSSCFIGSSAHQERHRSGIR